jgi:hypothetical protein
MQGPPEAQTKSAVALTVIEPLPVVEVRARYCNVTTPEKALKVEPAWVRVTEPGTL